MDRRREDTKFLPNCERTEDGTLVALAFRSSHATGADLGLWSRLVPALVSALLARDPT